MLKTQMAAALTTTSLTRRFGDFTAVQDVNLSVEAGQFYGFLGPNGAGKSTTIKMLTGLLAPTSGAIEILGMDFAVHAQEVKRQIGVVPEGLALFGRLTGFEYLRFVGSMYGLDRATSSNRAAELLDFMDLAGEPKKLVTDYSHGMQKKIALAAAVIHGPKILFLDEPFEGVDAIAAGTLKAMLQGMIARGATIFLTSHVAGDRRAAMQPHRHHRPGKADRRRFARRAASRYSNGGNHDRWRTGSAPEADTRRDLHPGGRPEEGDQWRFGIGDDGHRAAAEGAVVAGIGGVGIDGVGIDGAATHGAEIHVEPSAGAQLRAIAWLRWRLLVNGFRRRGGKGELVARILLFPFLAAIGIGPIAGAGVASYYAINAGSAAILSIMTWAVFAGWIFVMSATTLNPAKIDLSLLLRFPMRLSSYVVTRFFFGLLATPNVIGSLALAAAAIGIGVARPRLFPWAALVLFCYALMMILLLRMVLLWLDRWLAQRRTREIVGIFFTLIFLLFQFVSMQVQTWAHHRGPSPLLGRLVLLAPVIYAMHPVFTSLPPALAAASILNMQRGATGPAIGMLAGLMAYAAGFTALFVLRLRGEFRGENFSEVPKPEATSDAPAKHAERGFRIGILPPAIAACVEKELHYLVRGPSILISVLTPLVLVGLYANRMGSSEFLLPGAMAYTLFSMLPMLYNVLGQDAAGAQMYLLSPTPIRTVFLAKNLMLGLLIVLVAGAAAAIVAYSKLPPAPIAAGTALWFLFVLFTNLNFGNFRSIHSPIKVDMGKVQRRQGVSQLSTFIVLAVLFGSLLVGFAILWICRYLGHIWAAPGVLLVMAMVAIALYVRSLGRIERVVLEERDGLIEVLCKT